VFASIGIQVLLTAPQAPRVNAYAERRIGSIRCECCDRILIIGQAHLRRVLAEYIVHHNRGRSHQGRYDAARPERRPSSAPIPHAD
jgi:hypothetical protein